MAAAWPKVPGTAIPIMSKETKREKKGRRSGRSSGGGRPAFVLFSIAKAALLLLPHRWALACGPVLGKLGYLLDARHRKVVHENLALAMPELDEGERIRIARACFSHFGFALFDLISSSRFDGDSYLERCEATGIEHLEAVRQAGRGVLFLSAHYGCWEAMAQYLALTGNTTQTIYRPLDNPHLDRELMVLRERFGNESVPKTSAARAALKTLRKQGRVGILVDQRVHPNDGEALPFFGHTAFTSPLPAQLSLRTGAPVLPVFAVPDGSRGYRIVVREPIWPEEVQGSENPEKTLSIRYLEITEAEIRRAPELWLWMHRRWRVNPVSNLRGRGLRRKAPPG